jgi:hypothetical protein
MAISLRNKIKAYDLVLQKHIDKKDFVKIDRMFQDREESFSGFLLALSKDFLLVQVENEFLLNGYSIIRKDQFHYLICTEHQQAIKRILRKEGTIKSDYGIDFSLNLKSWPTIFNDLKKNDYHAIVECEDGDEPQFTIGIIKRVNKNSVGIQYYDPTGVLDKKLTAVKYDDITRVTFGDRYSTIFRKYLQTRP